MSILIHYIYTLLATMRLELNDLFKMYLNILKVKGPPGDPGPRGEKV